MKIFKIFAKEQKGIGLVEYVLILCLVGSIVVVVSPPLRQAVGDIYETQTGATDNMNGMNGSRTSGRVVDSGQPGDPKAPNESKGNTGEIGTTPDPTPVEAQDEKMVVKIEVKSFEDDFPEQVEYDKGEYSGMLTRAETPPKVEVIEKKQETYTKDVTEIVRKNTLQEMEDMEGYEKTDMEGYTGMLNPSGEIQYVYVGSNSSSGEKPSGTIVYIKESSESNQEIMEEQFPSMYFYEEIDSSTGVYTGYKGDLPKQGEMKQTIIQNGTITTYRYEQEYSGIITQGTYEHAYVYEQNFSGTLFKTVEQDVFEYTQTYSGTVIRKR